MATRDLTGRFLQLREFRFGVTPKRHSADTYVGLLEEARTDGGGAGAAAKFSPIWLDRVHGIDADLKQLKVKMQELSALHSKRLVVSFDDLDEGHKEREIAILTQDITSHLRKAERDLKLIASDGGGPRNKAEETVRQNIQKATARKLQNLSMSFRSSQKEYLGRLKRQKEGGNDFEFLNEENEAAAKMSHAFGAANPAQVAILEESESYVQERDAEIRSIVKNIEELSEIFKELAAMVVDQGTVLDRIDFNMEQVVDRTKEGMRQLQKAEEHQRSALPMKCIAVLLVLIFIMIILLIVKHTKWV